MESHINNDSLRYAKKQNKEQSCTKHVTIDSRRVKL